MATKLKKHSKQISSAEHSHSNKSQSHVDPALIAKAGEMLDVNQDQVVASVKKNVNKKSANKKSNEQDSGQFLDSDISIADVQHGHNLDVTGLKTNLFNAETYLASSASNDSSNNNRWAKYVWIGAAGLGAAGVGIALSNVGGSGSGSDSPIPPTPSDINNFDEFCASNRFEVPTHLSLNSNNLYDYYINQGFERPDNFRTFSFDNLDYGQDSLNVGASGLAIDFNSESVIATVDVAAGSSDNNSELIWMKELSINSTAANTNYARADINISANAYSSDYQAEDAEIGICDLNVNLESQNAVAKVSISAYASDNATSQVTIHDINLNVHTSDSGYVTAGYNSNGYFANGAYITHLAAGAGNMGSDYAAANISLGNISIAHESSSDIAQAGFVTQSNGNTYYNGVNLGAGLWSSLGYANGISDLHVDGNVSIEATNTQNRYGNGDAFATAFGVDALDRDNYDVGVVSSIATFGGESNLTVDGDINVNASVLNGDGLARATFAQNNSYYFTRYGDERSGWGEDFVSGIQAFAGEDFIGLSSEANIDMHDINISATARNGYAEAYFADGSAYTMTTQFEAVASYDAVTNVNIGDINIAASGKLAASAGMVSNEGTNYFAELRFNTEAVNYYGFDNGTSYATSYLEVGDININASANGYGRLAEAFFVNNGKDVQFNVTAFAENDSDATTKIGNISIEAQSTNVNAADARAYMVGYADAYYDNSSYASINMTAQAGQSYYGDASGYSATANVVIGDINIEASTNAHGEVEAFMAGHADMANINLSAYASDFATATLHIGDIDIEASRLTGAGNVTAFMVGEADNPNGYPNGYENLNINAFSKENATSTVQIGDVSVNAFADHGSAYAALVYNPTFNGESYMRVNATAYGNSDATISIDSINVSATSLNDRAYASLIDSSWSNWGAVNITAYAGGWDSPTATINIDGGINVNATAQGDAYATLARQGGWEDSYIMASAYDDSLATVNIGQIDISAHSSQDSAYAAFTRQGDFYLKAYTNSDNNWDSVNNSAAEAYLNIDGINVEAIGKEDAHAYVDQIVAESHRGGYSEVNVIGDISVVASAEVSNYASIDFVQAFASDYSDATVNIGNINLSAGNHLADQARTDAQFSAYATDNANARINLGNITMSSQTQGGEGDSRTSLTLDAFVGEDSYHGSAIIHAGDIQLSASGISNDDSWVNLDINATVDNSDGYDGYAKVEVGDITMTSSANLVSYGNVLSLDIHSNPYTGYANIKTGDINVNLLGSVGSQGYISIDANNYDEVDIGNLTVNVEDADSHIDISIDSVAVDQQRYASFSGQGDVYLNLDTNHIQDSSDQFGSFVFDKIYLTGGDEIVEPDNDLNGEFHLNWGIEGNTNMAYVTDENTYGGWDEGDEVWFRSLQFWNDQTNNYSIQIPTNEQFTFEIDGGNFEYVPHTTIYGYNTNGLSSIVFNGVEANDGYLGSAYDWNHGGGSVQYGNEDYYVQWFDETSSSPITDVNDLWDTIMTAWDNADDYWYDPSELDSSHPYYYNDYENVNDQIYIYTVFDETYQNGNDINGDGYLSSHLGVLAYDQDKADGGLTALVFLNDINGSVTANAFSGDGLSV